MTDSRRWGVGLLISVGCGPNSPTIDLAVVVWPDHVSVESPQGPELCGCPDAWPDDPEDEGRDDQGGTCTCEEPPGWCLSRLQVALEELPLDDFRSFGTTRVDVVGPADLTIAGCGGRDVIPIPGPSDDPLVLDRAVLVDDQAGLVEIAFRSPLPTRVLHTENGAGGQLVTQEILDDDASVRVRWARSERWAEGRTDVALRAWVAPLEGTMLPNTAWGDLEAWRVGEPIELLPATPASPDDCGDGSRWRLPVHGLEVEVGGVVHELSRVCVDSPLTGLADPPIFVVPDPGGTGADPIGFTLASTGPDDLVTVSLPDGTVWSGTVPHTAPAPFPAVPAPWTVEARHDEVEMVDGAGRRSTISLGWRLVIAPTLLPESLAR